MAGAGWTRGKVVGSVFGEVKEDTIAPRKRKYLGVNVTREVKGGFVQLLVFIPSEAAVVAGLGAKKRHATDSHSAGSLWLVC